jgi:hypothetical protein
MRNVIPNSRMNWIQQRAINFYLFSGHAALDVLLL